jgi:hypothetical protein
MGLQIRLTLFIPLLGVAPFVASLKSRLAEIQSGSFAFSPTKSIACAEPGRRAFEKR